MTGAERMCPYFWGSHGCDLADAHEGDHECHLGHVDQGDNPVTCPRGHSDVFHGTTHTPEAVTA